MPQYDAMFKFASLAAAKADPVVQQYMAMDDAQQMQFEPVYAGMEPPWGDWR